MKVLLGLADEYGCGHYRMLYPAAASGVDTEPIEHLRVQVRNGHLDASGVEADVIVIQRPLKVSTAALVPALQEAGIAVVVDVDDDFSCLDRAHLLWSHYQPQHNPDSNREHIARACRQADLVTVTTPALARRYGAHGRVAVLPNFIPRHLLELEAERDGRTVGWGGAVDTHPRDLDVTHGGVAQALRDTGARFRVVGPGRRVREKLALDEEPEATDILAFADYFPEVARLDVGIAPLADIQFNHAKSALKGLEYAALGVPFVASPTPDYERIAADGIGVLAPPRARSWARAVRTLLGPEGRERAAEARQIVAEKYLIEDHGWRWAEAWEQAIANRKKAAVSTAGSMTAVAA